MLRPGQPPEILLMSRKVKIDFKSHHAKRVRPIQNKVLLSIFNTLGDIKGLSVLDLYAGIGSLAIEALSQSASTVDLVDISKTNLDFIKHKYDTYRDRMNIFNTKVETFITSNNKEYDLIFFDPPYALFDQNIALDALDLLKSKGVMVLSMSSKMQLNSFGPKASVYKERLFGGTKIIYLVKK